MSEKILDIKEERLSFFTPAGEVKALNGVSFAMNQGDVLGIVGESGSGKSMTAFAVTRLLPGEEKAELDGSIHLCGRQLLGISRKSMEEVRGRDVSMIFQEPMTCLNPVFTIGTQMMDVIRTHEKMSSGDARKKALAMLEAVHIRNGDDVISCYPYQLSGGMRQRVGIAMAMAFHPKLLLADEPTSALDVTTQAAIVKEMMEVRKKMNTAIIIVTHNMGVAAYMADRIMVMRQGRVVEYGKAEDVIYHPREDYTKMLLAAVPVLGGETA